MIVGILQVESVARVSRFDVRIFLGCSLTHDRKKVQGGARDDCRHHSKALVQIHQSLNDETDGAAAMELF